MAIKDKPVNKQTGKAQPEDTISHSRRTLLLGGAAIGLAGASVGASAVMAREAGPGAGKNTPPLDQGVVAQCEKMLDLAFDDDERAQILATLDDQLEGIRALRGVAFDNADAPALVFDPRLPGSQFAPQSGGVTHAIARNAAAPGSAEDVAYAPVTLLSRWIESGEITSREITEIYLERIARYRPMLENFVTVTDDLALEQATRADQLLADGQRRGPLHGIPYGLKDIIDTKNIPTTWGATPFADRVAKNDATIVKMLENAGAVLLGKTTNGAIAYGDIWFGGVTRNPWNPREGSSGSSAGSASATAAGLCGFSIGTETLGSIVSPSARCGTTGLRPTFGRVPRTGAMALCWSLDKLGPICRTAADTALVLEAINGPDQGDPSALQHGFQWDAAAKVDGFRVGYDPAWFQNGHDIDRKVLDVARSLPVEMVEIALPDWPYQTLLPQLEAEAAAAFQELTLGNRDDELVWQADEAWPNSWRRAHFLSAVDLIQVDRFRRRVMAMMAERFADLDVILSPNFAGGLLIITNYTGHPCLTMRAGFTDMPTRTAFGLPKPDNPEIVSVPHNITLWGPLFEERKLLTMGAALEQKLGVSEARPPLDQWRHKLGK
ncbi:amidase [Iodidimonas nitroreducens]|uniref:Amidase n=1 Tax=Iodidimonas nitroreducens TaxID=1236968 RepID=A0A5A7NBT6_9PROT|nr:amidase [Iodidimonas nitroreducens]GAK32590.1 glutamyl-tRNA(Gln) amidotransferase subunit A [alpha proteobacterium Q-1]GER04509.1 amidase [Iodidimonas nitroreducens]